MALLPKLHAEQRYHEMMAVFLFGDPEETEQMEWHIDNAIDIRDITRQLILILSRSHLKSYAAKLAECCAHICDLFSDTKLCDCNLVTASIAQKVAGRSAS